MRAGIDVIFVAGPPGAGKTTTTVEYVKSNPTAEQFGAGELILGIRSGRINSKHFDTVRTAAEKDEPLPSAIFSEVIRERIMRSADSTQTLMVTGFPFGYDDWDVFNQSIATDDIELLGAVALDVGLSTSVARMRERDILAGANALEVHSMKERVAYEKRYASLMGRLTIRLDCYRQTGLEVKPIFAERSLSEVMDDFNIAINSFNEGGK